SRTRGWTRRTGTRKNLSPLRRIHRQRRSHVALPKWPFTTVLGRPLQPTLQPTRQPERPPTLPSRRHGCVIEHTGAGDREEAVMTEKQSRGGDSGAAPVDDPRRLRNVALVGPSGSGKTTLAEALLVASGTVPRAGAVVDGTTVCDHDPVAVRHQRSVALSVAPVRHGDTKINLIDTPGYADFVGELRAGLRAADAALFVVSAGHGVDTATVELWNECARVGMPRAVLVSRVDHARADVDAEIAACAEAFGAGVLPLYLPASDGTALVGLITGKRYDYAGGHPPVVGEPDPGDLDRMHAARAELIEGIIAESEDETLMDRYLAGEEIAEETLIADLETAVSRGAFHPVIPVCAET